MRTGSKQQPSAASPRAPGGEGGVWWRHDDPDADLTFEYAYPELKK